MSFKSVLEKYRKIVDSELNLYLDGRIKNCSDEFIRLSYSYMKDYVLCGGKRLRPIALIMGYFAVTGKIDGRIKKAGLCVEFLHSATLVHDDVMDEDEYRRDSPTMHKKFRDYFIDKNREMQYEGALFSKESSRFAVANAICGGNILFTMGCECILDSEFRESCVKEALEIYNECYMIVNEGQIMDNYFERRDINEKDYMSMSWKKTGELFLSSIMIGAKLGNARGKELKALSSYAKSAASAFQLQDDILSVNKEHKNKYGEDIRKGKRTLLIIKALENSGEEQQEEIKKVLGKEDASSEQIDKVVKAMEETGALEYVQNLAKKKIEKGKRELKDAKINKKALEFFYGFADFMLSRSK
ncbi:hypothetical protein GF323_05310 [Candidatus Woesearchaeota archaeon]|nr:hypothetical protein [Candidatus Woesearchaeota archaeon]